jgi:Tol biopolymer transport system component
VLAGLVGLLLLAGVIGALWLGGSGDAGAGADPTSPTTPGTTPRPTPPATSPTGTPPAPMPGFVAYATRSGGTSTVRVLDLSTGRSRVVADDDASEPSVSADGRTVAYVRNDAAGRRVVVDRGRGSPQVLDVGRNPRSPAISPDGRAVAYVVETAGGQDVMVRDLADTGARPVAEGSADERDPTWSPDGSRLGYVLSGSAHDTVVVLDARDLTEVARTVTSGHARSPALSPDGDDVAYVADVQGNADVVVAPLGSDDPDAGRNLSQSGETELGLVWLPDGRLVSSATGRGLVAVDPTSGATDTLTSGAADAL